MEFFIVIYIAIYTQEVKFTALFELNQWSLEHI